MWLYKVCGDMLGLVPVAEQMPKLRMYAPRLARNFLRKTEYAI